MDIDRQILTLKEVAEYLGVHTSTIYKFAQNGKIPAFKIGSDWRFRKEEIDAWIKGDNGSTPESTPSAEITASIVEDQKQKLSNDIAVIGMACYYPGAETPKQLWENILSKRVQFRRLLDQRLPIKDYYDADPNVTDKTYLTKAAFIDNFEFDWSKWRIPRKTYESTDVTHWLALDTAFKAFIDAGYQLDKIPIESTGVILGNTLTGEQTRSQTLRLRWPYVRKVLDTTLKNSGISNADTGMLSDAMEKVFKSAFFPITEDSLAGGLANTIAGRICNYLNFKGGGYIVDGACSSSLLAVATAANALRSGDMDLVLAGGVDISLDPFELVGFARVGALAKDQMRVYDKGASGFIPGEGCGFILLKRMEDALKDKNYVYAVLKGWGISSDGRGGIMEPSSNGQAYAIKRAYKLAGYPITQCDFIEGHGTGTTKGDRVELEGINSAIKSSTDNSVERICGITSFKSIVGHTKAAAGIGGLIKAIMAVNQRILPPTANCVEPNDVFNTTVKTLYPLTHGIIYPKNKAVRAGVSAAGFGGINCHITLESKDQPSEKLKPDMDEAELMASHQETEVFVFASRTTVHLLKVLKKFKEDLRNISMAEMCDLAFRLNKKAKFQAAYKVAVVTDTPENLYEALQYIEKEIEQNTPEPGEVRKKKINRSTIVLLSNGVKKCRIGYLYPGQASQHLNMSRMLLDRYQWARDILKTANLGFEEYVYKQDDKLLNGLYDLEAQKALAKTEITQPAVSFSSLAWTEFLSRLGIEPKTVGGHSLGEIPAFHKAGAFDYNTMLQFARFRGETMAVDNGQALGMVSMLCSEKKAKSYIDKAKTDVIIANVNCPQQVVLSGVKNDLDKVVQIAKKDNIVNFSLPVSNAFHTRFMNEASQKIGSNTILPKRYQLNGVSLYSCIDGKRLKGEVDLNDYFAKQVLSPVNFIKLVKAMSKHCDIFIEVGPGRVLTDLVSRINKARGPECIPVESFAGMDSDINTVLAALFVRNIKINFEELYTNRLVRPFVPVSRRKFIVNQCERPLQGLEEVPHAKDSTGLFDEPSGDYTDVTDAQVVTEKLQVAGSDQIMHILIDLIHNITGFDKEMITPQLRLLDDLNLDSIKAAELIAEATKQLDIVGEIDPSQYSNSTLKEIESVLLDVVRTKRASPAGISADPASDVRWKYKSWVRNFITEYKLQPIGKKDSNALTALEHVLIISDESGLSLADEIKDRLSDTCNCETALYDDIDDMLKAGREPSDCIVSIMPVSDEHNELDGIQLKKIIHRLHDILRLEDIQPDESRKTVCFVQFAGGQFGEDGGFTNIFSSCSRAVASTLFLEKPNLNVRILDFDQGSTPKLVSNKIIDELQIDKKFSIAGYDSKLNRFVPVYHKSDPADYTKRKIKWGRDDVVLVTGGAKGITAECALEFARLTKATMILLGRSPNPKGGSKNNEITDTLKRFKGEKLKAEYYQCDITDARKVEQTIEKAEKRYGRVTGFIHGAGLITLSRLTHVSGEDAFNDARPKVLGGINVLKALDNHKLKLVTALTSVIGVTGMEGSGWYGLSNEIFNLYLKEYHKRHKKTAVSAIAYSIWDKVGMGVRLGSVDRLSYKGVYPIPVEEGVKRFARLVQYDPGVQQTIVVAKIAGVSTWQYPELEVQKDLRFIEDIKYLLPGVELVARARLNVKDDPYLLDHNWKGSLLFPLVFGLEAMAQAAYCLNGIGDHVRLRFKDVVLERPIAVNPEASTSIEIHALALEKDTASDSVQKFRVEVYTESTNFKQAHFSAILEFLKNDLKIRENNKINKKGFKKRLDINVLKEIYGRILFQGSMFQCLGDIFKLYYKENIGKGECNASLKVSKEAFKFLEKEKKYKRSLLMGNPFLIDSSLHTLQLMLSQDSCLPSFINELYIDPEPLRKFNVNVYACSVINKVDPKQYSGKVDVLYGEETALKINGCMLKVLEHIPSNPKAEDIVDPINRDEAIIKSSLSRVSDEHNFSLPSINIIHNKELISAGRGLRHKIEKPIIKNVVEKLLGDACEQTPDIEWLHSGKPKIRIEGKENVEVSISHDDDLLVCIAGFGKQGCDVETIVARNNDEWMSLLGKHKFDVVRKNIQYNKEIDEVGTVVWSICEVLRKIGSAEGIKVNSLNRLGDVFIYKDQTKLKNVYILAISVELTRNIKKVIALTVSQKSLRDNKFDEHGETIAKKLGYDNKIFAMSVCDDGPEGQPVYVKMFPITFKNNQSLSRTVYFSNFFKWVGEVREYALQPIIDQLSKLTESGIWGISTNHCKVDIVGELKGSDIVETRLWLDQVGGKDNATFDWKFDFRKVLQNGKRERVALAKVRTTWIKILGHGVINVAPMPAFMNKFINDMKPKLIRNVPQEVLPESLSGVNVGKEIPLFKHKSKSNRRLLVKEIVGTTLEDSNLVGNIYFAHYAEWLGRVRDKYLYNVEPLNFKGIGKDGELVSLFCHINHLHEAMPFDNIIINMYIKKLYNFGFDLEYEYYLDRENYKPIKLASAIQRCAWVRRIGLNPTSKKLPSKWFKALSCNS